MEDHNYVEQLNRFEESVSEINKNLSVLGDGVEHLAANISKLQELGRLNDEIASMTEKCNQLKEYNHTLQESFNNVDALSDASAQSKQIATQLSEITTSVQAINSELSEIEGQDTSKALRDALVRLRQISDQFGELQTSTNKELTNIKTILSSYQSENQHLFSELKAQNETLQSALQASLQSNQVLMDFLTAAQKDQAETEAFMKDFIKKWYKENVGLLGNLKNK